MKRVLWTTWVLISKVSCLSAGLVLLQVFSVLSFCIGLVYGLEAELIADDSWVLEPVLVLWSLCTSKRARRLDELELVLVAVCSSVIRLASSRALCELHHIICEFRDTLCGHSDAKEYVLVLVLELLLCYDPFSRLFGLASA